MRLGDGVALLRDSIRFQRSQWLPLDQLRDLQRERLAEQLRHARRSVPFYRHSWPSNPEAHLAAGRFDELPLVRRSDVQRDPKAFLSEAGDPSTWQTSLTSGSTGRPLRSHFDPDCWRQVKYALKLRRLLASGWRPGHRVVIVEALRAAERDRYVTQNALPGEGRLEWLLGSRAVLSLFDAPSEHLGFYRSYRPRFIYAPPSYLATLSRLWGETERERVPLRALMTSGEWTHPAVRERIRDAFAAPVLDVYGSTEFKEIAWQCAADRALHVNMESVWVEVVDEAGRPVPMGQTGQIVVTSLLNRAMPLVRYVTADVGALHDTPCPCGRRSLTLSSLEGRTVDVVMLPSGRRVSPYALTTAIETCPGIEQYRFVQSAHDRLRVEVAYTGSGSVPTLAGRVEECLREATGGELRIEVHCSTWLTQEPSGKCRPVSVAIADHAAASRDRTANRTRPEPPTPDEPGSA